MTKSKRNRKDPADLTFRFNDSRDVDNKTLKLIYRHGKKYEGIVEWVADRDKRLAYTNRTANRPTWFERLHCWRYYFEYGELEIYEDIELIPEVEFEDVIAYRETRDAELKVSAELRDACTAEEVKKVMDALTKTTFISNSAE